MRTYKTEGIIIKRVNYGEADRILTIFTKHYGKIRAIAKGVRRINSRRGGNLELFNYVTLFLNEGRNFDIISEAEVKDGFVNLRKNLKKVGLVYYLCELVDGLCPERQENLRVFELLYEAIKNLEMGDMRGVRVRNFAIDLLKELGYLDKNKNYPKENIKIFIENLLGKKIKSDRVVKLII